MPTTQQKPQEQSETCKESTKYCNTHDMPLIQVWRNGVKIDEYCPVCYREMMRKFDN